MQIAESRLMILEKELLLKENYLILQITIFMNQIIGNIFSRIDSE